MENKINKILKILKTEGIVQLKKKVLRRFLGSVSAPDNEYYISNLDYDFDEQNILENKKIIDLYNTFDNLEIKTINWFLPYSTGHAMGGRNTIHRFAKYFAEKRGVKNRFIYFYAKHEVKKNIKQVLRDDGLVVSDEDIIIVEKREDFKLISESDAAFATRFDSVFPLLRFNKTKSKFYFMQDFESMFWPAGTNYAVVESTYGFGFSGIANSPDLCREYLKYSPRATYFVPGVNKTVYYPAGKKDKKGPVRIFFYGRPSAARNGFKLGLAALKRVKAKYGDKIEIISAGEFWNEFDYGAKGIIKNLGVLRGFENIANLYRECDIGLTLVFSKGSPLMTLEVMATGLASVTNYNVSNSWILKDGFNCLIAEASVSRVVEKLSILIENQDLRERIAHEGVVSMGKLDWTEQIEKIWDFMTKKSG